MLDPDPLAEPGTALRGLLRGAQLDQERLVGVDLHAAPAEAGGALGRSGQAWHVVAGNCTLPPGVNGIVMLLGQVSRCWSKSKVNAVLANRGPLRTGNALQKTARSGSRPRTRLLAR